MKCFPICGCVFGKESKDEDGENGEGAGDGSEDRPLSYMHLQRVLKEGEEQVLEMLNIKYIHDRIKKVERKLELYSKRTRDWDIDLDVSEERLSDVGDPSSAVQDLQLTDRE